MTTPTEPDEGILAKVRGLLAKAESTTFPAEAEALTAKATALMAKYAIDASFLRSGDSAESREPTMRKIVVLAPYADEKCHLVWAVARMFDVHAVRNQREWVPKSAKLFYCFGLPHNLEMMEMLFVSLELQAVRQMPQKEYGMDGIDLALARSSFINGFANEVGARIVAMRDAARAAAETEHGSSVSLVLVDDARRAAAAAREMFPNAGAAKGGRIYNGSAYGAGKRAGANADLGQRRMAAGVKGALGRG